MILHGVSPELRKLVFDVTSEPGNLLRFQGQYPGVCFLLRFFYLWIKCLVHFVVYYCQYLTQLVQNL